jgi:hypothetical protein
MKHGCKPTYEQRKLIQKAGLDSHDWLVVKDTSTELVLVSRDSKDTKSIPKGVDRW